MLDWLKKNFLLIVVAIPVVAISVSCNKNGTSAALSPDKSQRIERGEYLVRITGCNDCHTPGYPEASGEIPVEDWLVGTAIGWYGPWGTTYPINLRLYVNGLSEDQWIQVARNVKSRPPMPWYALKKLTDEDLVDMYLFIKHLGPAGGSVPAYLPPAQTPKEPYISFPDP